MYVPSRGYYTKVRREVDYSGWYSEYQLFKRQKKKRNGISEKVPAILRKCKEKRRMVPRGPRKNKNEIKQSVEVDNG